MRRKNTKVAALCGAAAMMALSGAARAEVVLLGDDPQGWVFSVDGFINAFTIHAETDAAPATQGGALRGQPAYSIGGNTKGSSTHVTNGLMPEQIGFNVKSPDLDGNKIAARVSIQTGMTNGNNKTWDADGASTGTIPNLFREAYVNINGGWGEVQAGKSLGIFGSQAILNDMYLFGVGAGVASQGNGQNAIHTTTGGIGYGYTYAGWNGNIRYTTPAWGGAKATLGIFEPNSINTYDAAGGGVISASKTALPRFEGGVNWAGKLGETTTALWANGTWQQAEFAESTNPALGGGYRGDYVNQTVHVYGGELGGKVVYGPMDFVAHGYVGKGLGVSGAQLSFDSMDLTGRTVTGYGYYLQGQYHFPQGTSVALRYGSSYQNETGFQEYQRNANIAYTLTQKDALGVQVYHQFNKYLRVVSEFDYVTNEWADNAKQHETITAAGVVVTF